MAAVIPVVMVVTVAVGVLLHTALMTPADPQLMEAVKTVTQHSLGAVTVMAEVPLLNLIRGTDITFSRKPFIGPLTVIIAANCCGAY